jgi:hypothetical protein
VRQRLVGLAGDIQQNPDLRLELRRQQRMPPGRAEAGFERLHRLLQAARLNVLLHLGRQRLDLFARAAREQDERGEEAKQAPDDETRDRMVRAGKIERQPGGGANQQ